MKILLSNDDGWFSDGITILFQKLQNAGHEVEICAPDKNRSGVSHGFTVGNLAIEKIQDNIFSCSGLPADCVIAALSGNFMPFKPDIVMAGINHGANLGTDLIYSGTAAAARQAVLYGLPAVAFSIDSCTWSDWKFDALSNFATKNAEALAELSVPCQKTKDGTFVNVNALSADTYKGVKFASSLAFRDYNDTIDVADCDGVTSTSMKGGEVVSYGAENSDAMICRAGFISVSCVYVSPFCQTKNDISRLVL